MKLNFKNKNIIITGGTSGIGKVVAANFLDKGASVLVISSTKKKVEECKKSFSSGDLSALVADVSDTKSYSKIRAFIKNKFKGKVDVLVNAAGIYGPIDKLEKIKPRDWTNTFFVNVFGTVYMCMLVIPFMKKKKSGKIINFSGGGDGPFPRFTAYSSSKIAVVRFTESLGKELRDYNIQVNTIAPGAVNTGFLENVLRVGPEKAGKEFYLRSVRQKREGGISPQKSADLILFLSSEKAGKLTGKIISAVWDDWKKFPKRIKKINSSDVFNTRRINPKDRGLDW